MLKIFKKIRLQKIWTTQQTHPDGYIQNISPNDCRTHSFQACIEYFKKIDHILGQGSTNRAYGVWFQAWCLLCTACKLRMFFTFLNGWKKYFVTCNNDIKFKISQKIKYYWNRATILHLHIASTCFHTEKSWVAVTDTVWATKPKIHYLVLYRKSLLSPSLGHKASLWKFQGVEIIQSLFCAQRAIKLKIYNKRITSTDLYV